jgi:hypothetical protein
MNLFMLEKLDEPIAIIVKFSGGQVVPVRFVWRGQTYEVAKLNMVHHAGAGDDRVYYFSVSDSTNFFRLAFRVKDLSWRIEELFY